MYIYILYLKLNKTTNWGGTTYTQKRIYVRIWTKNMERFWCILDVMICVQNVCVEPILILERILEDAFICHQRAWSYTFFIIFHNQECVILANSVLRRLIWVYAVCLCSFSHAFSLFHKCVLLNVSLGGSRVGTGALTPPPPPPRKITKI